MRIAILIALAACYATRPPPTVEPARPDVRSEAAVASAIVDCAPQFGITGDVRVHLDVDDDGGIGGLRTDRGDAAFASCAGAELATLRFPRDRRGREIILVVRAR